MSERPSVLAGSRRALTLGIVAVVTIVGFEAMAVGTALPAAQRELHGLGLYGWAFSGFFLATLIGITAAGEMCDRVGPARPFVAGVALFTLGLVIAGLAPSMVVLVVGRAVQGAGAGAIPTVAYVVVGRGYEEALRPRMFAIISSAWIVPALAGPVLAGAISEYASWRLVFLGLPPFVALSLPLLVPGLRRLGAPERPATTSSRFGATGLLALAGGLAVASATYPTPWIAAPLFVCAMVVGWPAIRRALPSGSLRAARGLPAVVAVMGLLNFAFFGADAFVPLTLTEVGKYGTLVAGLPLTVAALAWTGGSWAVERAAPSRDRRGFVRAGLLLIALGIGLVVLGLVTQARLVLAMVGWAVAGAGMGLAYTSMSLLMLANATAGEQGTIAASVKLAENLGAALGAGLGGALVAAADDRGARPVGLTLAFALPGAVAVLCSSITHRMPESAAAAHRGQRP